MSSVLLWKHDEIFQLDNGASTGKSTPKRLNYENNSTCRWQDIIVHYHLAPCLQQ